MVHDLFIAKLEAYGLTELASNLYIGIWLTVVKGFKLALPTVPLVVLKTGSI